MLNTVWASDSSDWITRILGFRITNLYLIKCLMRDLTKYLVCFLLISTIFYYTVILCVTESPLYYINDIEADYKNFIFPTISCWHAMTTLTTVGYGDVFVVSYLGRIFVFFLAILSSLILSFFTVSMVMDFQFKSLDKKSF